MDNSDSSIKGWTILIGIALLCVFFSILISPARAQTNPESVPGATEIYPSLFSDGVNEPTLSPAKRLERSLAVSEARGAIFGNPDGDITLYKFFDYNCSVCRIAHAEIPVFLDAHPNVRIVAVDIPVLGKNSREASALTFSYDSAEDYKKIYEGLMFGRGLVSADRVRVISSGSAQSFNHQMLTELVTDHYPSMRDNVAAAALIGIKGTPGFYAVSPGGTRTFTGWKPDLLSDYVLANGSKGASAE